MTTETTGFWKNTLNQTYDYEINLKISPQGLTTLLPANLCKSVFETRNSIHENSKQQRI